MLKLLVAFAASAVVMLVLDAIWLTTMLPFYQGAIGSLLAEQVRIEPAIAFYVLYLAGVTLLAVRPALRDARPAMSALLNGAILGLVAYGTYDLTNQATLKVWPLYLTLTDLAWGTALTAITALAGALAAKRIG